MTDDTSARIPVPERDQLTAEQLAIYEQIASGPRGKVEGPLAIWLHSPELAGKAQELGAFARFGTSFEPRLSELAILVVARHWTSHFEWYIHAPIAEQSGLDPSIIESIKLSVTPTFASEDEAAVYAFASEFLKTGKVTDGTLGKVRRLFGDRAAVELSAILGYYSMCAFTIALSEPVLPDGSRTCLP